jgi:aminoglycoside phosphotransferase (APT) family kinase protein
VSNLAEGLARFLSDEFGVAHSVSNVIRVPAGARRQNVLLDAAVADRSMRLVATIVPAAVQQVPVGVEAAVRELARGHGVPVPRVWAVCHDSTYVGAPFMISERVDGETVPRRVLRLVQSRQISEVVAAQLGDAMGRLHGIDPATGPAELRGDPGEEPAAALLEQMRAAVASLLSDRPVFRWALAWLAEQIPGPPPRRSLVHTDIRNGNVVVGDEGLRAILDWEGTCRFGDPMRDVGWTALRMWRFGEDDKEFGGFAGRDVFVRAYEDAGGVFDLGRFQWWKVLGTLWWGVGLATQAASFLDGSVRDIVMAASGRRIPEIEWDLLMLTKPCAG